MHVSIIKGIWKEICCLQKVKINVHTFLYVERKKTIPWLLRFWAACKYNEITIIPIKPLFCWSKDWASLVEWLQHSSDCASHSLPAEGGIMCFSTSRIISGYTETLTHPIFASSQLCSLYQKRPFGPLNKPEAGCQRLCLKKVNTVKTGQVSY